MTGTGWDEELLERAAVVRLPQQGCPGGLYVFPLTRRPSAAPGDIRVSPES